jgi:hypothetical protein
VENIHRNDCEAGTAHILDISQIAILLVRMLYMDAAIEFTPEKALAGSSRQPANRHVASRI